MNSALTGTALTLHNLGLAAGFGGSLFGQVALHPAVRAIRDEKERGRLVNDAWMRFSPANVIGLGVVGVTWLAGRTFLSGGEVSPSARGLTVTKDVLVSVYVATGIACVVIGRAAGSHEPALESGGKPSPKASPEDAAGIKAVNWLGRANILAAAGIIAVTAILNLQAGRSHRWALLSKILP